jgi:hypothetical protein
MIRRSATAILFVVAAFLFGSAATVTDGVAVVIRNGTTDNTGLRHQDYGVYNGELWRYTITGGVVTAAQKLYAGPATFPRISPDGSKVAFIKEINGVAKLSVIGMNGGPVSELAPCAGASLVDFASNEWIYYTQGAGQQDFYSRYLLRVRLSDLTIQNVAVFPCNVAQVNISRDLSRAVVRNSSPGVIDCGDEKAYAFTMSSGGASLGTDMTPGRICCVTAMFSDGQNGAFGWVDHTGTDIKPWGRPDTIVKAVSYRTAFGWPPNNNAHNPQSNGVGPVFTSRASTNNPYWECLLFNDEALLLVNWHDEQCINVTAGMAGNVGQGDFWSGKLSAVDTTPPLQPPTGCTVTGCTEGTISLMWDALPQTADPESGIAGYAVFRGALRVGGIITATSFSDSGLSPGSTYQYQIAGVNHTGMTGPKCPAVVGVTLADRTPPALVSVAAGVTGGVVKVRFSEKIDKTTAETATNYSITNGISVTAAEMANDSMQVALTVSRLTAGAVYTLTVKNVTDLAGNPLPANTTKQFTFSPALKARWQFEEGKGSVAYDSSGNGLVGALTGTCTYDSADTKEGRYSLGISGSGMFTATLPSWSPDSFTVAFWIKPDTIAFVNQEIFASNGWGSFKFNAVSGGGILCGVNERDQFQFPSGAIALHQWQHFAMTYASGVTKFYKNGLPVATLTGTAVPDPWTSFTIFNAAARFDDVRIHAAALSGDDILSIVEGAAPDRPIVVTAPKDGSVYHAGDRLVVQWAINPLLLSGGVMVGFSPSKGIDWYPLTLQSINAGDPKYYSGTKGTFTWTVPESLTIEGNRKVATACDTCYIQVYAPYAPNKPYDYSMPFSILPGSSVLSPDKGPVSLRRLRLARRPNGDIVVTGLPQGVRSVEIRDLRGRTVGKGVRTGENFIFSHGTFGTGVRFLAVEALGKKTVARIAAF